ncbi:hypothetical protein N5E99_18145 [Pseudomonas chengduensis]|jgi:hypothetical protein|uniref:Immunity protein 30 n=2 Tax=Pseudomonadaceae TaxID=135621 RepID=A0A1H2L6S2_9PSED|nr:MULTISPECIES: hypothetical protein [Pseudomonas]KQO28182.1 hypothetical protein ASF15_17445 [Pseudomonas sp. Leaf83]MBP3064445.1 hypothetical protein [Pseudomonas chengduensis]MDH0961091.1 hypothetical protein [Pseudomonas chengduensis]MDH1537674.1 hypothetical protein [Pseudomonas chengduensis]MDH1621824.1 hypothetical protein [Pseudomonas chengduensis]
MNRTEEELLEEVANLGDYDTAAEALHQLQHLNKAVAEHLAVDILRDNKGDEYFQASAFGTLYSVNLHKGIELIKNSPMPLNTATLSAMIECITEDSGVVVDHPEILEAAKVLKETIRNLNSQDSHRIQDTLEWFLETYPDI